MVRIRGREKLHILIFPFIWVGLGVCNCLRSAGPGFLKSPHIHHES